MRIHTLTYIYQIMSVCVPVSVAVCLDGWMDAWMAVLKRTRIFYRIGFALLCLLPNAAFSA